MTTPEEKRLQSLIDKKNVYKQQKTAIQKALLNIDSKPKNKIVFNDGDFTYDNHKTTKKKQNVNNFAEDESEVKKSNKLALFDEDNDSDTDLNNDFKIKDHFEGKDGKKLLELQSKFTSDKRFTLDSRFLEKDDQEEPHNFETTEENEKEHQLEILQNLLGKRINGREPEKSIKPKMTMLRFDPLKPDHSKFEMKKPETVLDKETKKKNKKKLKNQEESEEHNQSITVSKEKFYKVTDTLKNALQEKETFSLLDTFGTATEEDKKDNTKNNEIGAKILKPKQFESSRNPFKYDSSNSEDEERNDQIRSPKPAEVLNNYSSTGVWNEKFFFSANDQRLEDGRKFFSKIEVDNNAVPFTEVRREVRQVIRAKIRNNERNKRPFRVKLGGQKKGKSYKRRM